MKKIIRIVFLICLLLFSIRTNSQKDAANLEFYKTTYQDITDKSMRINFPFDFILPKNYSYVKEPMYGQRHYIIHNDDIDIININGGVMDLDKINYPLYFIEASDSFYYSKGKFSIEEREKTFIKTRIDQDGIPVLVVEGEDNTKKPIKIILMHPNYETWAIHIQFFASNKQPELSKDAWENLVSGIKGLRSNLKDERITRRKFAPVFPDAKQFSKDIYYNRETKPMKYPNILPELGKTTEDQLYQLHPAESIERRYTLTNPVSWNKGKEKVKFDCFIDYYIETRFEEIKKPGFHSIKRLENFTYRVFLFRGVVIDFNLIHRVDYEKGQEEVGPKNKTVKEITGDFEQLRIDYLRSRSSLFRRVIADEWFYEDYLSLSDEDKKGITNLSLKHLTEFPMELYKFKKLKSLSLGSNQLTEIKCSSIEGLENLEELHLSNSKFKDIPECLSKISKLKKLSLSNNPLKKIPSSILKLSSLIELDLNDTEISEIAEEEPNLPNLTRLELSGNRIKEIPSSWENLKKLKYLNLNENKLKKPPTNLSNIKTLEYIFLEKNEIEKFPEDLLTLNNLQRLDLARNKIKYLPKKLCNTLSYRAPTIYIADNPIDRANFKKIKECAKSYGIFPKSLD